MDGGREGGGCICGPCELKNCLGKIEGCHFFFWCFCVSFLYLLLGETINHPGNNVKGVKYLWVSEFGWGSNNVGENGQGMNLETAYSRVFANQNTGGQFVTMAMWFNLQDFGDQGWGLRKEDGQEKYAWSVYSNLTFAKA